MRPQMLLKGALSFESVHGLVRLPQRIAHAGKSRFGLLHCTITGQLRSR